MKKLLLIIILIAIAVAAYFYFTQPANEIIQPDTQPIEEVMDTEETITEDEMIDDEMVDDEMEEALYMDISPEDAKVLINENPDLIIIDVSPKYAEGHLPGAINYYIGDGSLDAAIPTLDPIAMYLVYCHVDSASIAGAQALIDAGFTNVYRLEGNYSAWVDAGYDVEM